MATAPHNLETAPLRSLPPGEHCRIDRSPGLVEAIFESDAQHLAPVRLAIESLCREVGFDEKAAGEIGLVVNEAIANIIRHAYGSTTDLPIEARAIRIGGPGNNTPGDEADSEPTGVNAIGGDRTGSHKTGSDRLGVKRTTADVKGGDNPRNDSGIEIQLRDWGNGRCPAGPARKRPSDPLTPGGLGLLCMHNLMDQVLFTPQPRGMLLTMRRTVGRASDR